MKKFLLFLSSETTDFITDYKPPIDLQGGKSEAALYLLVAYNTIPNIKENINNTFSYSTDNGLTWKDIKIGTGSYVLVQVNNQIERQMMAVGDYDNINERSYISIDANIPTSKIIVSISNDTYKVNFGGINTIGKILGFPDIILSSGYHESPNIADITAINTILVHTDLTYGGYIQGTRSSVIYSFAPDVSPGYKMIERPNPELIYLPISLPEIHSVRVWLTNEKNIPIDLRGEVLNITIKIREIN